MTTSRPIVLFKSLQQLGIGPVVLFALYKFGVKTGYYKRTESSRTETGGLDLKGLFKLPSKDNLRKLLGVEGERALLAEADEVGAGRVRLFGGEPVPLQLTFDGPLHHWTEYELHPQLIMELDSRITDIKIIWEPARFSWAFVLGRAWHLTGDDRYAGAFWKYFEEFTIGNPPYLGPHWMNGQEVALRLMALVWAAQVLESAPSSGPEKRAALCASIMHHASRIPPTLVYARSQNNNHLVTEAAGLYTAGLALKNSKWRDLGWRWLNWSFQNQIGDYGEYIQHSTNYHRVMLHAALWADAIRDDPWPHRTMQALARASHFLFSILDPVSGRVPNLGANDGALILPLSAAGFEDYRPTVQAAARSFLGTQMPPGPWDELPLWLGLGAAAQTYEPEHYLSDNLRGKNSWAYLRASRFKSRLGHMDQLHLDLWWRGLNIAQDAGTYLYNAPPPWGNPLVTTRVHNTVTADGREQRTLGGRFLALDWFPAYSETLFESDSDILQRVRAYHNGYRGIRHTRTVTVYSGDRWLIEDTLTSRGSSPHLYRLHLLLPDWEWKLETAESKTALQLKSPHGWITLTIITNPLISNPLLSIARAGQLVYGQRDVLPFEGWFSPTYGVKIPALSLALEVRSSGIVTFTTRITLPD